MNQSKMLEIVTTGIAAIFIAMFISFAVNQQTNKMLHNSGQGFNAFDAMAIMSMAEGNEAAMQYHMDDWSQSRLSRYILENYNPTSPIKEKLLKEAN